MAVGSAHPATPEIATVDLGPFIHAGAGDPARAAVVSEIRDACTRAGFFQVVGHGIDHGLRRDLEGAARGFFALDDHTKAEIAMEKAGAAWRGWFPVGAELTSGVADAKEGIYFGCDLGPDDPSVRAGIPLHGPNLYPVHPPELAGAVAEWMALVTAVGSRVLAALALGLGLPETWFDRWCADPVVLFRIFHYPATGSGPPGQWGVAEHTDYGLLTLLAQDDSGGLQVRGPAGWIDVPPTDDALVCNLGDMLERVTAGRYRSTPHRVCRTASDRISMPLFLDPAWEAVVTPIPDLRPDPDPGTGTGTQPDRWDDASVFDGPVRYGDYLTHKVAKVFPELFGSIEPPG